MRKNQFIECAVKAGVVPNAAVDDPEGYDNGHTLHCLSVMWTAVCEALGNDPDNSLQRAFNYMLPFVNVDIRDKALQIAEGGQTPLEDYIGSLGSRGQLSEKSA